MFHIELGVNGFIRIGIILSVRVFIFLGNPQEFIMSSVMGSKLKYMTPSLVPYFYWGL